MAKYVRFELYEVWTSLCILLSVADSFKLVVASSFGGKHIRASVCDYGDAGSLEVSPFFEKFLSKAILLKVGFIRRHQLFEWFQRPFTWCERANICKTHPLPEVRALDKKI